MINAGTVGAYLTLDIGDFTQNLAFAGNLLEKFRKDSEDNFIGAGGLGGLLVDALTQPLAAAGKTAAGLAREAADEVCAAFSVIPEKSRRFLLDAGEGMNTALQSAKPLLFASAKGLGGVILSGLDNTLGSDAGGFYDVGNKAVLSLIHGMNSQAPSALSAVGGIMKNMLSAAGSVSFTGIGGNIVDGIIKGMNGKKGSLISAAAGLAESAAAAAKHALGINSPSRVMMELGKYAAEGLEIGLQQGARRLYDTASAISLETADALGNFSSSGMHYSGLPSLSDRDRPDRLDRILDAVERLADARTTMEIDGRSFGRIVREYA